MKPLVSFIIPYYNLPLWMMKECVGSICDVRLDAVEREIIVVDDGSREDIRAELAALCPDMVYVRQENGGLSAARNTGISVARGRYIQFVDGDDRLIADAYSLCVDKLRTSDADLLMFRHTSGTLVAAECAWTAPVPGADYMCANNLRAAAWGYVFSRSLLGDLRFTLGTYHEDEEFTPQLVVKARRMAATGVQAYFYRLRPESITTTRNAHHTAKRLDDVERIIKVLHGRARQLQGAERDGMLRRTEQLAMDYIFNSIRMERSHTALARRMERLRAEGLYPLPKRSYTRLYSLFRLLANNGCASRLLILLAPLFAGRR